MIKFFIKADVIVNTTSPNLMLNCGILSKRILKSAGDEIQSECKNYYPNGIDSQEVAITSAGKISQLFMYIFHITSNYFESDETNSKLLNDIILNCLNTLVKNYCYSISFPSIGTGHLNYPPEFVAKQSLETAINFITLNKEKKLKINFVVFEKDSNVLTVGIKVFK